MAYCTVDELARALRKTVTVENTAGLEACVEAAAVEIDHEVDRDPEDPLEPTDPLANRVNIVRGVEWAKANDAAFGIIGGGEIGALHTPKDGFGRHAAELLPLKRHWGLA